ncbi:MAG: short-chain dehydrogenase, partial [Acidobacteriota bacterium]
GLLRTPAEGADTTVWLVAADEGRKMTGRVFLDRRPRPFDRLPSTRLSLGDRRKLWDLVLAMTGEPDPAA